MVARLQSIVMGAERFDESVTFYRDVLGLPVSFEDTGFCFLDAGGVTLAIRPIGAGVAAPLGRPIYLEFAVDDLDAVRRRLIAVGMPIERQWADEARRFLLLSDPSGHLVELSAPRALTEA